MEIVNRLQNQYRASGTVETEIVSVKENESVFWAEYMQVCT